MYSIMISIALSLFCHTLYADSSYSNYGLDLLRKSDIQIENYIQNLISDRNLESTFMDFLKRGTSYKESMIRHERIERSLQILNRPDIYPFKKDMTIRHYRSFWNAFAYKLRESELITRLEYSEIKSVFARLAEAKEQTEPLKYIAADLARIILMENLYKAHKNILPKRKR